MAHCLGKMHGHIAIALLAALPLSAHAQDRHKLTEVNPNAGFSSVSRAYPGLNARYARIGTPRTLAQVRTVAVGQSQDRLENALGRPAIRNGDGSYEYHLSLPLARRDRLICQYRVFFDGDRHVERAVWRRPQCAALVLGTLK